MQTQDVHDDGGSGSMLTADEEAAIRLAAQKVALRISEDIMDVLSEIVILVRESHKQMMASTAETATSETPATRSRAEVASSDILTVPEVARELKISKAKAYQLVQQREIRSIVVDRTVRVRHADLENFVRQHERF